MAAFPPESGAFSWSMLQQAVELGYQCGEQTPWVNTVRTCLEGKGIEPTNNAAWRALRQSVIGRQPVLQAEGRSALDGAVHGKPPWSDQG